MKEKIWDTLDPLNQAYFMVLLYFTFAKRLDKRGINQVYTASFEIGCNRAQGIYQMLLYSNNFHPIVSLYNVTLLNLDHTLKNY